MLKTFAIVIVGLAAGFALATWWPGSDPLPARLTESARESPLRSANLDSIEDLKSTLLDEIERSTALERRVQALSDQLDELRAAEPRSASAAIDPRDAAEPTEPAATAPDPQGQRFRGGPGRGGRETPEERVARFIAAGFPPDRAEWITQRAAELQMKMLEAQYNARRDGTPFDPAAAGGGEQTLRAELGDSDYERYLEALDRPTRVDVGNVLTSSPAESAGMKSGDEIVSYAGARVFDMRELNRLTLEGQRGESVIVEVLRDGQRLQLVLPRGPVGITGGRFGGP